MMTTNYPHASMQPQGMPHGQPMAPGPNQGHPGMPHMQMHPGVSGPNGPVSQAGPMMAGMQQGVGPSPHALSHLQPQQASHMFQQQQQQMQMNPALLQQQRSMQNMQQQQAFLHRQQQMLNQHQAQSQNGMGMGFPTSMAGAMNPQIAAMQNGGMGGPQFVNMPNLPPHLQTQLRQQQIQAQQQQQQNQQQQHQTSNPQATLAAQQAQAVAAQHAVQAQAQHAQQQQHQQQLQQQHLVAMQHAQSQQSNHSQSGSQGPPTTTQPQQAPLRPPSAIGSHQGQASPAPQPTPQQQPQPGPPPQQQTPAQSQPQNGPQQANPPTNQQAQNPQQQMQQRAQAMSQVQQNSNQAQLQAQAQARMAMMQQHQQPKPPGQMTLKLLNFVDHIGRFSTARGVNKIETWQVFVDKFFSDTGSFINNFWSDRTEGTKQWEIIYAAIPRYFYTLFNTHVETLQITIDGAQEKTIGTETKVTCDRAKFIYTYKTQCPIQVVCRGKLTAFWAGSDKLEWLQFEMEKHETYIQRAALESLFSQPSPNQLSQTQSPRMNKSSAKHRLQQQRLQQPDMQPILKRSDLPTAEITEWGIPPELQSYLEIYETMNQMRNLMVHYQENPNLDPNQAMNHWVTMMSSQAGMGVPQNTGNPMQAGNMPQNAQLLQQGMQQPQPNMPPGARTPSGAGQPGPPNQFMSPAMANSLLPNGAMSGSPHLMQQSHTPSPASHPMVAHHSQQGSSAAASVNTSPNVTQTGKRRRSTAKIEPDDGGPEMNGATKVKQSPRVGGNKRIKG